MYTGTVDTRFELNVLADYCHQLHLRLRADILDEYRGFFSKSQNFTFVADTQYEKQMAWNDQAMEDVDGIFQIFASNNNQNPYPRCKTSTTSRKGQTFHIHVYYKDLVGSLDLYMMGKMMSHLNMVSRLPLNFWYVYLSSSSQSHAAYFS